MDDNTKDVLNGLRRDKAYITLMAVAAISREKAPALAPAPAPTPAPATPRPSRLPWFIAALALIGATPSAPVKTLFQAAGAYRTVIESDHRP